MGIQTLTNVVEDDVIHRPNVMMEYMDVRQTMIAKMVLSVLEKGLTENALILTNVLTGGLKMNQKNSVVPMLFVRI